MQRNTRADEQGLLPKGPSANAKVAISALAGSAISATVAVLGWKDQIDSGHAAILMCAATLLFVYSAILRLRAAKAA